MRLSVTEIAAPLNGYGQGLQVVHLRAVRELGMTASAMEKYPPSKVGWEISNIQHPSQYKSVRHCGDPDRGATLG